MLQARKAKSSQEKNAGREKKQRLSDDDAKRIGRLEGREMGRDRSCRVDWSSPPQSQRRLAG